VINYTWDLPKGSKLWNNGLVRLLFDDWQLSGENAFASGDWAPVLITTTDNFDFTGGTGGQGQDVGNGLRVVRPNIVGNIIAGNRNPAPDGPGGWLDPAPLRGPRAETTETSRATSSARPDQQLESLVLQELPDRRQAPPAVPLGDVQRAQPHAIRRRRRVRRPGLAGSTSRSRELRVVEHVVHLPAELQAALAADREVLEEREIPVVDPGRAEDVARLVSVVSARGPRKGAGVEPAPGPSGAGFRLPAMMLPTMLGRTTRRPLPTSWPCPPVPPVKSKLSVVVMSTGAQSPLAKAFSPEAANRRRAAGRAVVPELAPLGRSQV